MAIARPPDAPVLMAPFQHFVIPAKAGIQRASFGATASQFDVS